MPVNLIKQVKIPFVLPVRYEWHESGQFFFLIGADNELIAEMFSVTLKERNAIVYLINQGVITKK